MAAEVFKMKLVVNHDLKLPKGKLAAQVGHAVSDITLWASRNAPRAWMRYRADGAPKIVLKADAATFEALAARHDAHVVRDEGRTCGLEPGTATVVGFWAAPDPTLDALKLL